MYSQNKIKYPTESFAQLLIDGETWHRNTGKNTLIDVSRFRNTKLHLETTPSTPPAHCRIFLMALIIVTNLKLNHEATRII